MVPSTYKDDLKFLKGQCSDLMKNVYFCYPLTNNLRAMLMYISHVVFLKSSAEWISDIIKEAEDVQYD